MTTGELGVVTMAAAPDAVVRAGALAASLRIHEPSIAIALLVLEGLPVPPGCFDEVLVIRQPEPFVGPQRFLNKLVHPFRMTPFDRTLFLDDDTLAIRPIRPVIDEHFAGHAVAINTRVDGPTDPRTGINHLEPSVVCHRFGRAHCLNTNGGGHMYFEDVASCRPLVERAICIATDEFELYRELSSQEICSDELALLIAFNEAGVEQPALIDFVDALSLRQANEIGLDIRRSLYRWNARPWGERIEEVRMVHLCSSAKRAVPYSREIHNLTGRRQSFDAGGRGVARRATMRLRQGRSSWRFPGSRGRALSGRGRLGPNTAPR